MTPSTAPRLFTIPAGEPFLIRLAQAILAGDLPYFGFTPPDPVALAGYTVLVPTRRAARALAEAFLDAGDGAAMLLPRIRPIGDIDEDDLMLGASVGIDGIGSGASEVQVPQAAGSLDMKLMIAREILTVVRDGDPGGSGFDATPAQALLLAGELATLIDAFDTEEVDIAAVKGLVADEYAHHWAQTLGFLEVITHRLPALLAERGQIGPAARRNRLVDAEIERLETQKPLAPIIAAGSTGSIPATARLLKAIAGLENGAVVLPGLDLDLDEASWTTLPSGHPQYGMQALISAVGVERDAVQPIAGHDVQPRTRARFRVLNEALRPAETTDVWRDAAQRIDADDLDSALGGLEVITAPSPREEALAIALIMRETLETPGRTAALVTPDRGLARHVATELRRWGVEADDSAGIVLANTPAGTLLLAVMDLYADGFSPVSILTLLKHPLAAFGLDPGTVRRAAQAVELAALRGPRPKAGISGLREAIMATRRSLAAGERVHRSLKNFSDSDWITVEQLLDNMVDALSSLTAAIVDPEQHTLQGLLRAHVEAAEAVCRTVAPDGETRDVLWAGDAGEMLAGFVAEVIEAPDASLGLTARDYRPFLDRLLRMSVVRPRYRAHPRINIWGPLEARLLTADVMVLGGMNEAVWPPTATVDAWLNRPMRSELGLPPPERRIGLAAHDFVQAACSPVVYLTRSQKTDGAPTVPSRWLLRLKALLDGLGGQTDLETPSDRPWLAWAQGLDGGEREPAPTSMPHPVPPVEARPDRLSVTRVEAWIRDPYSVFAREILKLDPLDPIDADPGASDRGTAIHEVMHRFAGENPGEMPFDALERIHEIGRTVFADLMDRPGIAAFWWPRFLRAAAWFVEQEEGLRRDIARQITEIGGQRRIAGPAGGFTVTARADRIDVLNDGRLRILDYKTGAVPSAKQVRTGLSPQLALEAAIAINGGFEGVQAYDVAELVYLGLSGGDPPGEIRRFEDAAALAADAITGLERRVTHFSDPATPYLPRQAVEFERRAYDYDHLARYLEWALQVDSQADQPGEGA